ncbi:MAG: hypothetical protein B655_1588 [Methanobacterium sp. Maddingley MBC34]|nr:MAG: hypothetical protein B655_1588 [Methanobacterium sp. Maddingley MBC34]
MYELLKNTNLSIDEILNLYFPVFLDMISYYNDPEEYFGSNMSEDEIEDKKKSIEEGLKRLRHD